MSSHPSPSTSWLAYPLDHLVPEDRPICYGVLKPGDYIPDGVPLVRILDLEDNEVRLEGLYRVSASLDKEFARSRLEGGELLISIQGTVGRVAIAPDALRGANISRTIARVALSEEVDSHFLRQWLLSDLGQKELADAVLGTTRDSLNIGALRLIGVPLPPLSEQRRIAEVLDTADEAIGQTEALMAKLKQMKQGLLHDLLTRGLDENGELRDPVAHPEQFKDSPLGRIPRAWEIRQLRECADVRGGKRLPAGHAYADGETGFKYLRVTDFFERQIDWPGLENLEYATFLALQRYEIDPGDLFISIAGSLGHVGVLRPNGSQRIILTENAAKIIVRDGFVPEFLAVQINGTYVQRQIEAEKGTGGGVPKLALFRIEKLLLSRPSFDEQERIVSVLSAHEARIRAEEAYRDKLRLLKKGLMQDLLTGRVRVPVPEEEPELLEVGG